jgi:uncharacterized protein HemY
MSTAALRGITANFPYMLFMLRADIELGRGDLQAARAHLEAAHRLAPAPPENSRREARVIQARSRGGRAGS